MGRMAVIRTWAVFLLILIFLISIHISLEAVTLNGTVKGKGGGVKKYVRVKVGGDETKTTFTEKNGTFSIQLVPGEYRITIIERNRSMEFDILIPQEMDLIEKTFELKW